MDICFRSSPSSWNAQLHGDRFVNLCEACSSTRQVFRHAVDDLFYRSDSNVIDEASCQDQRLATAQDIHTERQAAVAREPVILQELRLKAGVLSYSKV